MAGGVVVDGVESGGWAALARLESGDVILEMTARPSPTWTSSARDGGRGHRAGQPS